MENENQQQPSSSNGGGLKLMTVFIVVLALHVLVIGGVSAYSLLKGNTEPVALEENKAEKQEALPAATEIPVLESTAPVVADGIGTSAVITPEVTPSVAPVISETVAPIEAAPIVSAPVEEASPVQEISSAMSYQVAKGDTLSKIARIHGMKVAELKTLNGMKSDRLKIGQELRVKSGSTMASSVTTTRTKREIAGSAPVTAKVTSTSSYVVGKGDTLTKIAKQYQTTPSAIMAANKLSDARKLKIGMKLNIPAQARQQVSEQQTPSSTLQNASTTSADFAMAQ